MTAANAERGEISVDLEGVPHVLRPSFEAVVAIEAQTGRSIEELADLAGDSKLSVQAAAIVVTECVKAHGRAVKDDTLSNYNTARVGELIMETGKLAVAKRLELLLFLASTGGYSAKGEARALPGAGAAAGQAGIAG